MRDPKLLEGNSLILENKSGKDVIMESCFHDLLVEIFFSILDPDKLEGHAYDRVNMEFRKQHLQDFHKSFMSVDQNLRLRELLKFSSSWK